MPEYTREGLSLTSLFLMMHNAALRLKAAGEERRKDNPSAGIRDEVAADELLGAAEVIRKVKHAEEGRIHAKAAPGECGERYEHSIAGPLECCREAGHPGVHEGFTGTQDHPRDCEWRWWDEDQFVPAEGFQAR